MWFLEKLKARNREPKVAPKGSYFTQKQRDIGDKIAIADDIHHMTAPLTERLHIESEHEELRRGDW